MKKLYRFISVFLAALLLFGMTTAASAAERELAHAGLCIDAAVNDVATVVTFENGSKYAADGVIDLTATEQNPIIDTIDSLEIVCRDEVILTVEPKDFSPTGASSSASNGYYMVDFTFPNSSRECFISGMSAKKAETIQNDIISAWTDETQFDLEDVDFIDAEKLGYEPGDSELCWAGTISNMLHFTGWGEQAGFHSEDELFDIFPQNFVDNGYYEDEGLRWFFDGTKSTNMTDRQIIKDYPNSGRYLTDFDLSSLISTGSLKKELYTEGMKKLTADLRAGHAIGLSVITSVNNAHAITCWGFVTDNSCPENDASHYVSLIVADSDNDMEYGRTDRRTAPNKLTVASINRFEDEGGLYYSYPNTVYRAYCGALRDFTSLAPYNDSIPRETDPDATKNRTNTIDLIIGSPSVANSSALADFASDTVGKGNVTLFFQITDYSDIDFFGSSDARVTLYQNGAKQKELSKSCYIKGMAYYASRQTIDLGELDEGSYTAEITLNPDKTLTEAYYFNNTLRYDFTVVAPEYDVNDLTLSVELADQLTERTLTGTVRYDGIPEELLRGAQKVDLQVAQYGAGEEAYYSTLYEDSYSEINPILPENIRFNKTGENARFRLTLLYRGITYTVFSQEYPVRNIEIYIDLTDNNTSGKSPLPYGSTQLNDGEQNAFCLENRSWHWDSVLSGTYTLICTDQDGKMTPLSSPVAFSLSKGERTPQIVIRAWNEPLNHSGSLKLLFEGESGGVSFRFSNYLSDIRVTEPKSTAVTTQEDSVDPYDGQITLREAVAYAKELGQPEITLADGIDKITLDSVLTIDAAAHINIEKGRNITVNADKSAAFRVVQGGDLSLSGLFFSVNNQSADNGGVVACEGGKVTVSDCRFNYIRSNQKGGLLYLNGGTALMKNCSSIGGEALDGMIAYIEGGAQVEILNCLFDFSYSDGSLIRNVNGSLNLINSIVLSCNTIGGARPLIKSEEAANTNIVNSILLANHSKNDADGNVKLYACAYSQIGEQATADALSRVYQTEEMFKLSGYGNPVIVNDENSLYLLPKLTGAAAQGCLVTENDGVLSVGSDQENMSSIGVRTAFTAEELMTDMVGNPRQAVYGSYSRYEGQPILGDADGDGEVTVLDATLIQRYGVKLAVLSDAALKAADVDGSGDVTVIDATLIQRYVNHMKAPENIGKPF